MRGRSPSVKPRAVDVAQASFEITEEMKRPANNRETCQDRC